MTSKKLDAKDGGDRLKVAESKQPVELSSTAWLILQGVHYLNTPEKKGEIAYSHVVESLRRCDKDFMEAITGLFHETKSGDAPLRWSLLYILGDVGDGNAADFLVKIALKELPDAKPEEGCEGIRDTEMLISTMAVHAIQKIAKRHPEVSEHILKIVSEKPVQPILIEAVKIGSELDLKEKIRKLLQKKDQWILEIRKAKITEIIADSERENVKKRGILPPNLGLERTAPQINNMNRKEE
jgi:hypothetical protein